MEEAAYCFKIAITCATIAKTAENLGDKWFAQIYAEQSTYYIAEGLKYLALSTKDNQPPLTSTGKRDENQHR